MEWVGVAGLEVKPGLLLGPREDLSQQHSDLFFLRLLIKSTVPVVKIVTVPYPENDLAFGFRNPSPVITRGKETNMQKNMCSTEEVTEIRPGSFVTW